MKAINLAVETEMESKASIIRAEPCSAHGLIDILAARSLNQHKV